MERAPITCQQVLAPMLSSAHELSELSFAASYLGIILCKNLSEVNHQIISIVPVIVAKFKSKLPERGTIALTATTTKPCKIYTNS